MIQLFLTEIKKGNSKIKSEDAWSELSFCDLALQ